MSSMLHSPDGPKGGAVRAFHWWLPARRRKSSFSSGPSERPGDCLLIFRCVRRGVPFSHHFTSSSVGENVDQTLFSVAGRQIVTCSFPHPFFAAGGQPYFHTPSIRGGGVCRSGGFQQQVEAGQIFSRTGSHKKPETPLR